MGLFCKFAKLRHQRNIEALNGKIFAKKILPDSCRLLSPETQNQLGTLVDSASSRRSS
jgi:hypothetical protein